MLTILDHEFPSCYTLTPASAKLAKRQKRNTGETSVLFQTDWDFPSLARHLGWRMKVKRERCSHRGTDGTIDCTDCGTKASLFIAAADEWLEARCGHMFRTDDSYFSL